MITKNRAITFNILIKKEENLWVAHCLELDLVATAETCDQAHADIIDVVKTQITYAFENDNLDYLYHPAPKEVWKEFYECKKEIEDSISLEGDASKTDSSGHFVPPWIIARTCQLEDTNSNV